MDEPEKGEIVTACMDAHKAKILYDGSIDKLMLIILVRGDFHNKEMVGYSYYSTSSMGNLKYFSSNDAKHKSRLHQLDSIGSFLQSNIKHRVFVKL